MADEELDFVTVAKVGSIREGQGESFVVNKRMVAVFYSGGQYYAIDDHCPHMGASLAGGEIIRGSVVCPWHAWCFSITDGTWVNNPKLKVDCFELRIQDDEIQVKVPPRRTYATE